MLYDAVEAALLRVDHPTTAGVGQLVEAGGRGGQSSVGDVVTVVHAEPRGRRDVRQQRVVRVDDRQVVVLDLRSRRVAVEDVHLVEQLARIAVGLSVRSDVHLDGTAREHEVLQRVLQAGLAQLLVVGAPDDVGIGLPRQQDLLVVRQPIVIEVGAPVSLTVLGVGHPHGIEVLLHLLQPVLVGGAGQDGDIDVVVEGDGEVAHVARCCAIDQFSVELDVVGVAVLPAGVGLEGGVAASVRGQRLRAVGRSLRRLRDAGADIGYLHEDVVIAFEDAIDQLQFELVRLGVVDRIGARHRDVLDTIEHVRSQQSHID